MALQNVVFCRLSLTCSYCSRLDKVQLGYITTTNNKTVQFVKRNLPCGCEVHALHAKDYKQADRNTSVCKGKTLRQTQIKCMNENDED